MNTPPTQIPTPTLDPATLTAMQYATIDALPPRPDASPAQKTAQRDGALALLAALLPRNPVEATLAAGIVVAHYAAMDCFRRAARDDLTVDLHLRTVGKAIALCRMIDASMRDLARRQGSLAVQPAARPRSVQPAPAAHAQPTPEAAQPSPPPQPPIAEGRHERRRRERAERHLAAVHSEPAGARVPRTSPRSSGSWPRSPPVPRPPSRQPRRDWETRPHIQ
jgi:hypothetical protein